MTAPASIRARATTSGRNILPSTSSSEARGRNTSSTMTTENTTGRAVTAAACVMVARRLASPRRWAISCSTCSIITTAPLTMMPKSTAPRLIRLPDTPKEPMKMKAKSIEKGMAPDTMRPARSEPRVSTSVSVTSRAPSERLRFTVASVRSMNEARS